MKGFLLKVLIGAAGLGLAAYLIDGIRFSSLWTLLFASLLLGVVNAVVRPILVILTLPVTLLTLGLFLLVINAAMLLLVSALVPGFEIDSLWAAFWGWLVVTLVSWLLSAKE